MVNWDAILVNSTTKGIVNRFVQRELSGTQTSQQLKTASTMSTFTPSEFNRVIKNRGVNSTRVLARKALRRRNVNV